MSESNSEDREPVRDALVQITFILDGEQVETFTGTSMPVPREGERVRLSELKELDVDEEDQSESVETEVEEGEDHTVSEVVYNYYKATPVGDREITAPVTLVTVLMEDDNQEGEENE
jgi:hypothetical protein